MCVSRLFYVIIIIQDGIYHAWKDSESLKFALEVMLPHHKKNKGCQCSSSEQPSTLKTANMAYRTSVW